MTYIVNEEDYLFVKSIMIEHGFMAYFPGYNLKLLAEALKKHKIKCLMDRLESPAFASPAALSPAIKAAWEKTILTSKQT